VQHRSAPGDLNVEEVFRRRRDRRRRVVPSPHPDRERHGACEGNRRCAERPSRARGDEAHARPTSDYLHQHWSLPFVDICPMYDDPHVPL
jgi:hypothetical protein